MEAIIDLMSKNPYLVIVTASLSFLANFIQISTYFRDRRRIREERAEGERLFGELQKYKYVVGLAERLVKTEDELEHFEEDVRRRREAAEEDFHEERTAAEELIRERRQAAEEVQERMTQMRLIAQRQVVQNAIDRSITDLLGAYEDVRSLREKYAALGELPDIPPAAKAEIEREVSVAVRKPYELPRAFEFRALLIVALVFFLPWPVDAVLTVVFLHVFLALFMEAAAMYPEARVSDWVSKHVEAVGRWSAFGVWYVLFNFLEGIVISPLQSVFTFRYFWVIGHLGVFVVSIFAGLLHWRAIRDRVRQPSPNVSQDSGATPR